MLRLAGPVILAEIGWMSMGIVDTIMVGPLGPAAIGATGMASSVFTAFAIFGMGLMLGLDALYRGSIVGKAMRAVAFDRETAKLMGINVSTMAMVSFGVSAGLAAAAGVLISPITNASSEMGTLLGVKGFAAAAVGGLGTFQGAVLGGLLLGLVEVLASGLLWPGLYDLAAFSLLILVLLVRPTGLIGAGHAARP